MSGSLFDIIGPIMIGPSSSHTAGAVRLGNLVRQIAQNPVQEAKFILYNSFAKTYQGHGTDRGLLAGLLGLTVHDDQIRDAFELARKAGFTYKFSPFDGPNAYSPNTVKFQLVLHNVKKGEPGSNKENPFTIVGHSIGGGRVYLSKINDYNVSLKGESPTLLLFYTDQPGMIWQVTKIIASYNINIASLQCTREQRGGTACMTILLDELLPEAGVKEVQQIPGMTHTLNMDKLPE
ncbi:MAG: L-serine ammonia-lyase, iron-sulfur-dependent subunit beta [Vampirovibrio sp.]|nr:L-serine ammonia-lyase, iron-sulfur-dependent subunit beta [Vampirovibrio sp.]